MIDFYLRVLDYDELAEMDGCASKAYFSLTGDTKIFLFGWMSGGMSDFSKSFYVLALSNAPSSLFAVLK